MADLSLRSALKACSRSLYRNTRNVNSTDQEVVSAPVCGPGRTLIVTGWITDRKRKNGTSACGIRANQCKRSAHRQSTELASQESKAAPQFQKEFPKMGAETSFDILLFRCHRYCILFHMGLHDCLWRLCSASWMGLEHSPGSRHYSASGSFSGQISATTQG